VLEPLQVAGLGLMEELEQVEQPKLEEMKILAVMQVTPHDYSPKCPIMEVKFLIFPVVKQASHLREALSFLSILREVSIWIALNFIAGAFNTHLYIVSTYSWI